MFPKEMATFIWNKSSVFGGIEEVLNASREMGYLYTDLIEYKSSDVIKDPAASDPKAGSSGSRHSSITCQLAISNYLFS